MRLGQTSFFHYASNLIASLLGFAATIYFTQLLGPEVFGTYSLIIVVVAWLEFGGELGMTAALKKRLSERGDSAPFLVAGAVSMSIFFAATALIVIAVAPQLTSYIGIDATALILVLLGAKVLQSFVRTVLEGQHKVHFAGALEPLQRFGQSAVQIGLLAAGFGLTGMLIGAVAGIVFSAILGGMKIHLSYVPPAREHFKSLLSFAQFSWLDSLRGRSFTWMDIFVLGFFVPSALVGIYNAAWNVASFLAFGNAVASSFFPEMSEMSSKGDFDQIGGLISDTLAFTGLFLIPGLVGTLLLGDRILLFYGPEFPTGHSALILLVAALLVNGYFKQLLTALTAVNRPELAFRSNAAFISANIGLNVLLVWQLGWLGAAVGSLIASAFALGVTYRYIDDIVSFSIPYHELLRQVGAAAVMGGVIWTILLSVESTTLPLPSYVVTVLLVGLGAITFFISLVTFSPRFRRVVRDNVAPLR
ncbi:oligosaccharide flippase family protein [Halogeometricum sp. S1BR25-6]|uniref:Oligosaccharide flippase family protein n=1 Tax=Halogeometricum salsisoli TaxID=2950536 RepID=A0ABU2GF62_9EURY|nr:oligosaccharide flippase family protein [Halogeometricum sp. S1BR25-6]MDS0298839.1 oligosaccharide flippase family protein [Halogeometricum sp. S1BR25-6]